MDLDDLTGMTGAGLHMANLGGIWQAVVVGLAGVRVRAGVLTPIPGCPPPGMACTCGSAAWAARCGWTSPMTRTEIWADAPLAVALASAAPRTVTGTATFWAAG